MNSEERCICCGTIIPEGRQVCPRCEQQEDGIVCPVCRKTGYLRVMQTFQLPGRIRRRRKCMECGTLVYTEERAEQR